MNKNTKVIVGLSGGVDSSVAALLLKAQGYQVEGLFMKNWEGDDTEDFCPAAQDLQDVFQICEQLGIPLHIENFSQDYWNRVFEHFLAEYQAGRTPNPDILCNKEIKFKAFLDHAIELGADKIATGHYARIQKNSLGEYQLLKGVDNNKDQSYFLYALNQKALSKTLFPVGEIEKPKVREMAEQAGLVVHNKKDSTGICFIGERKFKDFLQRYLPAKPGEIIDQNGNIIGQHEGLMYYTLGQRKGLGIGGGHGTDNQAWFVAEKNLNTNQLIAVQGEHNPALYHQFVLAHKPDWILGTPPEQGTHLKAKIRYRQTEQACIITQISEDTLTICFEQPQKAVTPGQSIVFYDKDLCLGGAIIKKRSNQLATLDAENSKEN